MINTLLVFEILVFQTKKRERIESKKRYMRMNTNYKTKFNYILSRKKSFNNGVFK